MPRTLLRNDDARQILNAKVSKGVHRRLKMAAVESGRSLASEVEHRLETALALEAMRAAIRDEIRKCLKGRPNPKETRPEARREVHAQL